MISLSSSSPIVNIITPDARRFLAYCWRGGNVAYWWTLDIGTDAKRSHWFDLSGAWPDYPSDGHNVYFGVHPVREIPPTNNQGELTEPSYVRSQKDYISAVNCVYGEFDADKHEGDATDHVKALKPPPSVVIRSSPGSYHCYWLLAEPYMIGSDADRGEIDDLQKRWVSYVGSDAGAKDLARVLRVPGTRNYKSEYGPDYPQVKMLRCQLDIVYTLDKLITYLPVESQEADRQPHRRPQPINGDGSPYGLKALADECETVARSLSGSRNNTLNTAAHSLGQLVAGGEVKEAEVRTQLLSAAQQCGLGDKESTLTLNSGMVAGMKNPRTAPEGQHNTNHAAPQDDQPPPPPATPQTKKPVPTSVDFLAALNEMGYTFLWNQLDDSIEVNSERIDNGLAAQIRTRMRDRGFKGIQAIEDAYTAHAYERRYHPVRQYLNGLEWDGDDHIAELCKHFEDNHEPIVYHDKQGNVRGQGPVFRVWCWRWMLGAVAKAYGTGSSKVQNPMLVLDGDQDIGKSHFAAWLCSSLPELFIESAIHPDNKEHDRYLATKWIWEVAELGSTTRRADREALKAFITRGDVTFRKPYERHPIVKPALASFIGTLNDESGFLTDPTGNRRFISVTLKSINWQYTHIDVDQLWGQAAAAYRKGETWQLNTEEKRVRDALNRGYEREDPYEGMILKYFDVDTSQTSDDWFAFTTDIVGTLRTMGAKDSDRALTMGIGSALRKLGLDKARRQTEGRRGVGYFGIRIKP